MGKIEFLDQQGSFRVYQPEDYSGLYFPLAGDGGLKSCITPTLGGDSKRDQNHFLMEPVSIENLHNNKNTRNFWCRIKNRGYWSACGSSAEAEFLRFTGEPGEKRTGSRIYVAETDADIRSPWTKSRDYFFCYGRRSDGSDDDGTYQYNRGTA